MPNSQLREKTGKLHCFPGVTITLSPELQKINNCELRFQGTSLKPTNQKKTESGCAWKIHDVWILLKIILVGANQNQMLEKYIVWGWPRNVIYLVLKKRRWLYMLTISAQFVLLWICLVWWIPPWQFLCWSSHFYNLMIPLACNQVICVLTGIFAVLWWIYNL